MTYFLMTLILKAHALKLKEPFAVKVGLLLTFKKKKLKFKKNILTYTIKISNIINVGILSDVDL